MHVHLYMILGITNVLNIVMNWSYSPSLGHFHAEWILSLYKWIYCNVINMKIVCGRINMNTKYFQSFAINITLFKVMTYLVVMVSFHLSSPALPSVTSTLTMLIRKLLSLSAKVEPFLGKNLQKESVQIPILFLLQVFSWKSIIFIVAISSD